MITLIIVLLTAPSAVASESQLPNGLTGKDIYEGRCAGACHQSPPLRALSRNQWRVVLKTMRKRMESREMEPLSQEENEMLLNFLTGER